MGKHGKQLSNGDKSLILSMVNDGYRASEICKVLGRSKSTISMFLKRYNDRGTSENLNRSGRPKKVSNRGLRKLSRIVKSDRRRPLRDISAAFNSTGVEACSVRTVQRNLHFLGYKRRSVRKRVAISDVNKKKRIYWCRTKLTWKVGTEWKNVIFSDEMMIHLKPDGQLKVWRKASEKWRPECLGYVSASQGKNLKMMVWGCMCYTGLGMLAFIDGNMTSKKYIETLDQYLWPTVAKHFNDNNWIFQEDNAPTHKSREATAWKERNNIPVLFWPAQSPDLSPIENVWLLLKTKIKTQLQHIHNVNDLKEHLLSAWNDVPISYVQRLYSTLPRRVKHVLIQKGNMTKY